MQLNAGDRVGPYEVLGPLGTGGMGAVYRARDPKLGRQIAIKILQERLIDSPEYLTRFEQEARSASALNHPNIITIYEIGDFGGAPYIAMELVEGKRLRDLLREGPPGLRKTLQIATQIADGLAAAHERGIVHRDLKPENVMITGEGLVKILDFGLARLRKEPAETDDSTSALITAEGAVIGTAGYMSPEQANGSRVDFRSDQFSLGSILYEMLTLKNPFRRATTLDTLSAIVHDEPQAIDQLNPRIPPPLRWIIERCLAKDPLERYASTRDLARDLQTVREHLSDATTGEAVLPRLHSRRRALIAGIVLVAAVTATIALQTARRDKVSVRIPTGKSLAVLPFKDYSGRADSDHFGRGFAETLAVKLRQAEGLEVIPPGAAVALFSKDISPIRAARELGASMILDGSIQRAGEQMRVNYSVVEPGGVQLAAATVTGRTADLFVLQDDVADSVFVTLGLPRKGVPQRESGLTRLEDQEQYLGAIGYLQRYDDPQKVDQARQILERLAHRAPRSALVQAALGRTYFYKYKDVQDPEWSSKAIAACERAREIDPALPDVHLTLGEIRLLTGRGDEAIMEFRRALALQPNSAEATVGLADALNRTGMFNEAEKTYRRAIELRPAWWGAYNSLGSFYFQRGDYEQARSMFRKVLSLTPDNMWGYSNLGGVELALGDFPAALGTLRRAAEMAPSDAGTYANLGVCYYFLGRYSDAAGASRKAVDLRPQSASYWANLGDVLRALGQRAEERAAYDRAIELASQAIRVNPNNAAAHGILARCFARTGKTTLAQNHIELALQLDPDNPTRMVQAAVVANLGGDEREAAEWLQRAMAAGYRRVFVDREPGFDNLRKKNLLSPGARTPV